MRSNIYQTYSGGPGERSNASEPSETGGNSANKRSNERTIRGLVERRRDRVLLAAEDDLTVQRKLLGEIDGVPVERRRLEGLD